jgi:hypothetical protein
MICLLFYYIFKKYSSCITTSNECYPTQKYNHVMEQKQKPQARFGIIIWLYFCAVARRQSRSDLRGRGGHDNDISSCPYSFVPSTTSAWYLVVYTHPRTTSNTLSYSFQSYKKQHPLAEEFTCRPPRARVIYPSRLLLVDTLCTNHGRDDIRASIDSVWFAIVYSLNSSRLTHIC